MTIIKNGASSFRLCILVASLLAVRVYSADSSSSPFTAAAVAVYKREYSLLQHWLEYHRRIGFRHFYIYDNGDPIEDEPLRLDAEDCTVIPMPGPTMQSKAYWHFINQTMPNSAQSWFAFIDVDEYVVPVRHRTITAFLREYDHLESICLNWAVFSSDGRVMPSDPAIPPYKLYTRSKVTHQMKTMVKRTVLQGLAKVATLHSVAGKCRDLFGGEHLGPRNPYPGNNYTDIIRLNHYFSRSWAEFIQKVERGRADMITKRDFDDHIRDLLSFDFRPDRHIFDVLDLPYRPRRYNMSEEIREVASSRVLSWGSWEKLLTAVPHNSHYNKFVGAVLAADAAATPPAPRLAIFDPAPQPDVDLLTALIRLYAAESLIEIGSNHVTWTAVALGASASIEIDAFLDTTEGEPHSSQVQQTVASVLEHLDVSNVPREPRARVQYWTWRGKGSPRVGGRPGIGNGYDAMILSPRALGPDALQLRNLLPLLRPGGLLVVDRCRLGSAGSGGGLEGEIATRPRVVEEAEAARALGPLISAGVLRERDIVAEAAAFIGGFSLPLEPGGPERCLVWLAVEGSG